jgi:hypothetical protein
MVDLLTHFKPGEIIGLVAVAGGLLIAMSAVVGGFWFQARLTALKQDMVSRGMSADEIRAVIDAGSKHAAGGRGRHSCRAWASSPAAPLPRCG